MPPGERSPPSPAGAGRAAAILRGGPMGAGGWGWRRALRAASGGWWRAAAPGEAGGGAERRLGLWEGGRRGEVCRGGGPCGEVKRY